MTKVKAVIFDLDDTLFDCSGQLVEQARKRAAKVLAQNFEGVSPEQVLERQNQLYKKHGPTLNVFDKICEEHNVKNRDACVSAALKAYNSDDVGNITLFEGAVPLLKKLSKKGIKLVLITSGIYSRQQKKIEVLGLNRLMDLVMIHDVERAAVSKERLFKEALKKLSLKASETLCVGDRIQAEIKIGNKIGMSTARILHGRFKSINPKNDLEQPDFEIKKISELSKVISSVESGKNQTPKIVAIGGGTGLPLVLSGLKKYTKNITAIVTVTDSGRSSGVLRKDLGVLPPGDIRNCMIALSESNGLMKDIFTYRFANGKLEDFSFGNIFIAALCKVTGSFEKAVKEAGGILAIRGKIFPSTLSDVHICTELVDSKVFQSEDELIERNKSPKELAKRPAIKRVFLKPAGAKILPEARKAILEADAIIFGPGSLFTSVISNLLVDGMKEAITKSKAKKIYIANVMTQVSQTHGFKLSDHVKAIEKYLGDNILDFVVFNLEKPSKGVFDYYRREQSFFVENDLDNFPKNKLKLVGAKLIEKKPKQEKATKQNLLRHDVKKLGKVLLKLI